MEEKFAREMQWTSEASSFWNYINLAGLGNSKSRLCQKDNIMFHLVMAESARLGTTFEEIAGTKRFHVVIPGSGKGFAQTLIEAEKSQALAAEAIRRHNLNLKVFIEFEANFR